jgi:hypothetical protein
MANRNVGHEASMLLITLIVVPILWFGKLAYGVSEHQRVRRENRKLAAAISFEKVKIHTDNGYMYCEGKVRNNGQELYDYVKVKVEWLDKQGTILDTDYTFAVSGVI